MSKACVIVVDATRARLLCLAAAGDDGKLRLVEHSTLINPDTDACPNGHNRINNGGTGALAHHTSESRRRARIASGLFGSQITRHAADLVRCWKTGTVLLIAERRLLVLLRQGLRQALRPGIVLKELARNYSNLTPAELEDRLDLAALVSRRGSTG